MKALKFLASCAAILPFIGIMGIMFFALHTFGGPVCVLLGFALVVVALLTGLLITVREAQSLNNS